MILSDELSRMDSLAEAACSKIVDNIRGLLDGSADQMKAQLLVQDRKRILSFIIYHIIVIL
jgi:hypothetical protein